MTDPDIAEIRSDIADYIECDCDEDSICLIHRTEPALSRVEARLERYEDALESVVAHEKHTAPANMCVTAAVREARRALAGKDAAA